MCAHEKQQVLIRPIYLYLIALIAGIGSGYSNINILHEIGAAISDIFTSIFKTLSLPIISLSIIVTMSKFTASTKYKKIWFRTLFYTLFTTIIAASVSALLYIVIDPNETSITENTAPLIDLASSQQNITQNISYLGHLLKIVPTNLVGSFTEQNVLGVLIISIAMGLAIANIPDQKEYDLLQRFFGSIYRLFLVITTWVMAALPIALFGFVTVAARTFQDSSEFIDIGEYLLIVILANIIQGSIILPLFLTYKGINPTPIFTKMLPALTTAFFSKSSTGTLPVTMRCAEDLKINPEISRFVLPLCTAINMNGCAAFIFTTVIFVMQSQGIPISIDTIVLWIGISTVAAIGNAGVPMGCFFLSLSLLSGMNVPITLMGVILPFYSIIDMVETSLNVWSDAAVTVAVDKDMEQHY